MFLALRCPAHAKEFKIPIFLTCDDTKVILNMLHNKYREEATGGGMSMKEQVRLFESHDAGNKQTWTLIISNPNGLSCVIKGGQDWITNPKIPKGDPT